MPLKSAQNLWFSDDFKGKRVSLIHSNSLNIRSETWRRFHRKRFFDTYTGWVKFWIWSISRTVLTSFFGVLWQKKCKHFSNIPSYFCWAFWVLHIISYNDSYMFYKPVISTLIIPASSFLHMCTGKWHTYV